MFVLYYLILSLIVFGLVVKFKYKPENKFLRWFIFILIIPPYLFFMVLITIIFDNRMPSFYDIKKNFLNYVKEE